MPIPTYLVWTSLSHTSGKKPWALSATYIPDQGVVIDFRGATCLYPGTTKEDFDALVNAPSAGEHVWAHFYHLPYRRI